MEFPEKNRCGKETAWVLMTGKKAFPALKTQGVFELGQQDEASRGGSEVGYEQAVVFASMTMDKGTGGISSTPVGIEPFLVQRTFIRAGIGG
jgi:hypothetical protein